jgi:hypothetical protein
MKLIDTIDRGRLNGTSRTYGNDGDQVLIHNNNKLCWEVDYETNSGSKRRILIKRCNDENELQKFTIGFYIYVFYYYLFIYFL